MRTQEQPMNSNWHNYRYVLVLISIAVFVIASVILIVGEDNLSGADGSLNTLVIKLLAMAVIVALICYMLIIVIDWILGRLSVRNLIKTVIADEIRKEIKNVYNVELSDALNNDGVKAAIHDAISDKTKIGVVKTALANALIGNHEVQRETIFKYLTENIAAEIKSKKLLKNETKINEIINKVIKKCQVKRIISATLNLDDVKSKISTVNKEKAKLRNAIASSLKTDTMSLNEVRTTVSAALKDKGGKIEEAMSAIFEKVDISELIKSSLEKNDVKTEINKALNANELEQAIKSIKDALDNDEVKSAIETALKDSVVSILDEEIQSRICAGANNAENNEREAQKYRLVERVVEEICKGNKSASIDIDDLRVLIGSILNDDKRCCVTDVSSEVDKLIITMRDIKCNTFKLIVDYKKSTITSNKKTGTFCLCNGLKIKLHNNNIESIT